MISVVFKNKLSAEDEDTMVRTLSLMASQPMNLDADNIELGESELNSVSELVTSLLDSYISRHGNGVASVTVTVDPTCP
ncbi:Hypothetical protein A7982_07967 [Minicystis rosea]|nr:Hypothetical protein A7982_07967 [Minicystis rosea]